MAKLNLLKGTISGRIGDTVYSSWRGIPYTRSRPKRNPDYQPSPAQQAQQLKFTLANRFSNTLTPLLNMAFLSYNGQATGRNNAISYICKHAISGTAPHLELDYPRIRISQGDLLGTPEASATVLENGQVQFRWINIGDTYRALNSDKVLLVIYCPALQKSIYDTAAANRQAERATLDASAFSGHTVHCWLGFRSEEGKLAANSVYTGSLVIS